MDSAAEFKAASREDLAETEMKEAEFLSSFLPPCLSEEQIDSILQECLSTQKDSNPRALGMLMKAFYSKVDRSTVDGQLVKSRAERMLNQSST